MEFKDTNELINYCVNNLYEMFEEGSEGHNALDLIITKLSTLPEKNFAKTLLFIYCEFKTAEIINDIFDKISNGQMSIPSLFEFRDLVGD